MGVQRLYVWVEQHGLGEALLAGSFLSINQEREESQCVCIFFFFQEKTNKTKSSIWAPTRQNTQMRDVDWRSCCSMFTLVK